MNEAGQPFTAEEIIAFQKRSINAKGKNSVNKTTTKPSDKGAGPVAQSPIIPGCLSIQTRASGPKPPAAYRSPTKGRKSVEQENVTGTLTAKRLKFDLTAQKPVKPDSKRSQTLTKGAVETAKGSSTESNPEPWERRAIRPAPVQTPAVRPSISLDGPPPTTSPVNLNLLYNAVKEHPASSIEQIAAMLVRAHHWTAEESRQVNQRLMYIRTTQDQMAVDLKLRTPLNRSQEGLDHLYVYIDGLAEVAVRHLN